MNTIQLECFVAVAEHLNFSRASEALKLTQPAVSHQIRTLEDELGVKLFIRTSKSVSLTTEGIRFLPDAELILKTALSARDRLGKHENYIPLEIGCHNHMELNILPGVLEQLAGEVPLLRPSVHIVPFPSLLGMVESQSLHAAFGIKEGQKKTPVYFRELSSAPVSCICSPDHPLARHEALTPEMLRGPFISCSPRQVSATVFSVQSQIMARTPPEEHYFTENIESAFTLAKARLGFTLYPDVPGMREPGLAYIPVSDLPRISFGIFYRYDDDHPVLRRFLTLCAHSLEDRAQPFPGSGI